MASISDTVTLTSGTTSITSLIISGITQSNIAWTIGVMAGCAAIFSAYLGWLKHRREKRESKVNNERVLAETEAARAEAAYYRKQLNDLGTK